MWVVRPCSSPLLSSPSLPVPGTSHPCSFPATQLASLSRWETLQAVGKLKEPSTMHSLGCSEASAWQSHKSFISLDCMRVRRRHKISFEMATSYTRTHGERFPRLQTTARWSRLILLQKAMNKTCIDMHIKRQELTKQNKVKQRCFVLNLLWIPNTAN